MAQISLHHLTALDASPEQLVRIAAAEGCRLVSLFTYMPAAYRTRYPMVEAGRAAALAGTMRHHGVRCHSLEVFPLLDTPDWWSIREALDVGELLGAGYATVHSHLADPAAAAEQLAELARLANERGIRLAIEFNPYSQCASLQAARDLADRAGRHGAAVGLVLDTLHAVRCATAINEIESAAPQIDYVQLSDGPLSIAQDLRWKEAIGERMLPGAGDFPLPGMLASLRHDIVVDVEVPRVSLASAAIPAGQRCREALAAARAVIERLPRAERGAPERPGCG